MTKTTVRTSGNYPPKVLQDLINYGRQKWRQNNGELPENYEMVLSDFKVYFKKGVMAEVDVSCDIEVVELKTPSKEDQS